MKKFKTVYDYAFHDMYTMMEKQYQKPISKIKQDNKFLCLKSHVVTPETLQLNKLLGVSNNKI